MCNEAKTVLDAIMDWLNKEDDEEELIHVLLYLYNTTKDEKMRKEIFDIMLDCDRCIDCGCKLKWQEVETDPYDGDATTGFWYCPQCDDKYREDFLNEESERN